MPLPGYRIGKTITLEITLGYADCRVRYWTHAVGGLSENDFICAAKDRCCCW